MDSWSRGPGAAATHLRQAVSFLTVLPVGPRERLPALGPARAYFPLVGLLLGGGLAALDVGLREVFPPALVGAVLVAAVLIATRAMHVEGFVDCCDALLGGYTRERRLEILRDPHVGAFGVIGGAGLLLVQWAGLASLPGKVRWEMLVLVPCLSRWAMLMVMEAFPYARSEGMGAAFQRERHGVQVIVGFATALAASLGLVGVLGLAFLAVATVTAWATGRWVAGLLGGLTGDAYGAINELAASAALLLAIILANEASSLFGAPFYEGV